MNEISNLTANPYKWNQGWSGSYRSIEW